MIYCRDGVVLTLCKLFEDHRGVITQFGHPFECGGVLQRSRVMNECCSLAEGMLFDFIKIYTPFRVLVK